MISGRGPLPWLLPGIVLALVVSTIASGAVGRALGVRRVVAWVMLLSFGIILSATLTPHREAIDLGTTGMRACDLSRIAPAPLGELLRLGDTSLNVLLFAPLGFSLALLPGSRGTVAVILAAIALPFAIETIQLLVPQLDRACESADVVDNLTGLALGLVGGVVAGRLTGAVDRRPR